MKYLIRCISILAILCTITLAGCTKPHPSKSLNPILEKYISYWNTGEFQGIEETLHPDFELRMTPKYEPETGIESFKKTVIEWRTAYPDFHIVVNERVFDIDKIAVLWTIKATNTGSGSLAPTGKSVEVIGMSIIHLESGKIKDEWIASNDLLWMTQLGFTFVPPKTDSEK
jgi:predicted ester cyclase